MSAIQQGLALLTATKILIQLRAKLLGASGAAAWSRVAGTMIITKPRARRKAAAGGILILIIVMTMVAGTME